MPSIQQLIDHEQFSVFRRDLHRLMWQEPFTNHGVFDPGWSCRDHALVLAAVLQYRGVPTNIVHGKCFYVAGARDEAPPMGIGQEASDANSHTWLTMSEIEIVDLSPNLRATSSNWIPITFDGLIGTVRKCSLPASVVVADGLPAYEHEVCRASQLAGQLTAVYWPQRKEALRRALLTDPYSTINSPLTDKLRRTYPSKIYLKAVAHLLGILAQERRPLAGVSQNKAWDLVAQIEDSIVDGISETLWASAAS